MRVLTRSSTSPGGGPLLSSGTRFRHRRGVAQVVAGLLVAGGGLPLVASVAAAAPLTTPAPLTKTNPDRTPTAHSAVGKPSTNAKGKAPKNKKLGKAVIRAAADGSVQASAYGVYANVSLLGATGIGTAPTPAADYAAGPTQATTANTGVTGLLSTGVSTTTANGDDLKDTATATAAVNGLGTGTGLQGLQAVSADLVQSKCDGDGSGVTAVTTVTGLKLAGIANTTVPSNPAPNTVLNIAGLGTLTLNEQTQTTPAGQTKLVTNALHLRLLGGAASVVGQGDVIAGHTECTTTNAVTPTVTSFTPNTGPATGGTSVTITGTGFRGATDVQFGSTSTQYTIVSPTSITANSPAGIGTQPVKVLTSAGTGTSSGTFAYVGNPTVTGLTPSSGPAAGGTVVTIAGTNFAAGSTVKFGSAPATNVTVNSPTSITATSPAGTGPEFVTVTSAGSVSPQDPNAVFTYNSPAPTVSSISPTHGPTGGGTSVAVTGTNFTSLSVVSVDGNAVPTTYVSPTEVDFVTPQHNSGNATITVDTGSTNGTGSATFAYGDPTVTNMTPTSGPITGGTSVVVSGSNLDQVSSVTMGGNNAPITAQPGSGSTLTFTTPASPGLANGTVIVTLNGPGSTTTTAGTFTYNLVGGLPPVGLVMVPSTGPVAGGTTVTIAGVNLGTPTDVLFGGVPGTNFSFNLLTITVDTPPGVAPGDVPVTIVYSGGTTSSVLTNSFTYTGAAPTIGTLTPSSGPITGGTTVTVAGTGFNSTSIVYVNGVPVPTTYVNATTLTFISPPGTRGNAPVTVQSGLTGTPSGPVNFAYANVPVNAVALPLTGPTAGGTPVTITGLTMDDVTSLDIGGTTVGSNALTVTSTSVAFSTPAHASGAVTITLNGPFGTSVLPSLFVYTATAPSISTVNPTSGGLGGGYTVTLTGTGFDNSTAISVGGTPATNVNPNNAGTSVTFTMPAGLVAGAATVLVTTNGGTDSDTFTYNAPPTVSGITPLTGTAAGGNQVTLTGTGFTGATGVTIGGNSVTGANFSVTNATTIQFTTPAHAPGAVNVVVNGPNGNSTGTVVFVYTPIQVAPTISGITPGVGPTTGGTLVTISGTGFTLTSGITFGGTAATGVTVINDSTVVATSPAHSAGPVNVVVTNPVGGSGTTATSAFTYAAPNTAPVVDTITPASGPVSGGTRVVVKGLNLTGVSGVTFDGTAGTDLSVADNTTLAVTTPAHVAGGAPVVLTNANGSSSAYLFTYVPLSQLPTVSGLTPNVGPVAGGTRLTISGTNFDANTTVTFDGVAGTDLVLGPDVSSAPSSASRKATGKTEASRTSTMKALKYRAGALNRYRAAASNTLQVTSPPHAGGPVTVVVTNAAGSISFVESFTFIPVLASTTTIETDVTVGTSKAIAPAGPNYSGLKATACGAPTGLGSTKIASDSLACTYTATDTLGTDSFVMSVIDDLGQTSEQTVNVTVVAESGGGGTGGGGGNDSGGGTGGGGGNDSGDGNGNGTGGNGGNDSGNGSNTGGNGGNDSGNGLAFTGTPLLLIPGLALGLVLVLIGAGLLGAERFRVRRHSQPVVGEDGRQLMPAGLFSPRREARRRNTPDDAA